MTTTATENPKVVSRAEWLAARKELLAEEKALTRSRDALAEKRRELPWVKVDKNYVFETPEGKKTLADLFDGRSQLIVYHFRCLAPVGTRVAWDARSTPIMWIARCNIFFSMMFPTWPFLARRFPKLSLLRSAWAGSSIGFLRSAATSTTTITCHFQKRTWPGERFTTTSACRKFSAKKLPEPACSTRMKTETSSIRTPTMLVVAKARSGHINFSTSLPKGGNETGRGNLGDWVRHHDRYGAGGFVQASGRYQAESNVE